MYTHFKCTCTIKIIPYQQKLRRSCVSFGLSSHLCQFPVWYLYHIQPFHSSTSHIQTHSLWSGIYCMYRSDNYHRVGIDSISRDGPDIPYNNMYYSNNIITVVWMYACTWMYICMEPWSDSGYLKLCTMMAVILPKFSIPEIWNSLETIMSQLLS